MNYDANEAKDRRESFVAALLFIVATDVHCVLAEAAPLSLRFISMAIAVASQAPLLIANTRFRSHRLLRGFAYGGACMHFAEASSYFFANFRYRSYVGFAIIPLMVLVATLINILLAKPHKRDSL